MQQVERLREELVGIVLVEAIKDVVLFNDQRLDQRGRGNQTAARVLASRLRGLSVLHHATDRACHESLHAKLPLRTKG